MEEVWAPRWTAGRCDWGCSAEHRPQLSWYVMSTEQWAELLSQNFIDRIPTESLFGINKSVNPNYPNYHSKRCTLLEIFLPRLKMCYAVCIMHLGRGRWLDSLFTIIDSTTMCIIYEVQPPGVLGFYCTSISLSYSVHVFEETRKFGTHPETLHLVLGWEDFKCKAAVNEKNITVLQVIFLSCLSGIEPVMLLLQPGVLPMLL